MHALSIRNFYEKVDISIKAFKKYRKYYIICTENKLFSLCRKDGAMLRWRLFFAFSSIILLISGIIFGTTYFTMYRQILETTQTSHTEIFAQYSAGLSGTLETCQSELLSVASDSAVQSLLEQARGQTPTEAMRSEAQRIYGRSRGYLILSGEPSRHIQYSITIFICGPNELCLPLTQSTDAQPLVLADADRTLLESGAFLTRLEAKGASPSLSILKAVYDTDSFHDVIGYLRCEIPLENLRAHLFSPLDIKYDISTCLIDPKEQTRSYFGLPHEELVDACVLNGNRSYLASNYFIVEQNIHHGALYLIGIVSMDAVQNSIISTLTIVLCGTVLALALAFLLSLFYSSHITRPIHNLSETMNRQEYNDAPIPLPRTNIREIRELYQSFNAMIDTINELISKNYVAEINKRQSELSALQAQINTHFLYNTLDTVNWLAMDYGASDISLIVKSLSSLLRLSLNHGKELIRVQGELEHVRAYLAIQNIRFDHAFSIEYHIDERALDLLVPKMLLQPLVENALYHGMDLGAENNSIVIEISLSDEFIFERVKNLGTDIDLEKMATLTAPAYSQEQTSHYGVRNIAQRLEIRYGGRASYYYAVEDGYTVANIVIPRSSGKDKGAGICTTC